MTSSIKREMKLKDRASLVLTDRLHSFNYM